MIHTSRLASGCNVAEEGSMQVFGQRFWVFTAFDVIGVHGDETIMFAG